MDRTAGVELSAMLPMVMFVAHLPAAQELAADTSSEALISAAKVELLDRIASGLQCSDSTAIYLPSSLKAF